MKTLKRKTSRSRKKHPIRSRSTKSRLSKPNSRRKSSPFNDDETFLQTAFTDPPKDQLDTCSAYCQQAYKNGPPYPDECGYRQLTDLKTGRLYFSDSPTNKNCLSSLEQKGFELENQVKCDIWNRMFTRQQLLNMLRPYVDDPDELRYRSKKELCNLLSKKSTEVYYELESLVSNWCKNLQDELDTPEMFQVFALLQLPPPNTFFNKREACATLLKRIAEMKPPWYSRFWRFVTTKTKNVLNWVTRNPGKTALLAAGLLAAVYFGPDVAKAAQQKFTSATSQASDAIQQYFTSPMPSPMTQVNTDLSTLNWEKVGYWTNELKRLKQLPPDKITAQDLTFATFLENKLRNVTQGQLVKQGFFNSGFTNSTALNLSNALSMSATPSGSALPQVPSPSIAQTSLDWIKRVDPYATMRQAYQGFVNNNSSPNPTSTWQASAQSAYDYLKQRFPPINY